MISEKDKTIIVQCAQKFNASKVILFGSSLYDSEIASDIDLGVHGVEGKFFFKLYAALYKSLSKPVDLVDLTKRTLFNDVIEENGVVIYG